MLALERIAERRIEDAGLAPAEVEEGARGGGKLRLLDARLEDRYFGKVVRRLARRPR